MTDCPICSPPERHPESNAHHLLNIADSLLGLAVYRNQTDDQWKQEAKDLISRIREEIKRVT